MKKFLLLLVVLVAINGVFFLLCENKNTGVWISYGFVHFALLLLCFTGLLGTKGRSTYILNGALYSLTLNYFILELIVGSIFMALQLDDILWPLLVQGILWFVFMVIILGNAWANDETQKSLAERERNLSPLRDSMSRLQLISVKVKDMAMRKKLTDCYNELYYSASRQITESMDIDAEIAAVIDELYMELRQNNDLDMVSRYIEQLLDMTAERKELIKQNLYKHY